MNYNTILLIALFFIGHCSHAERLNNEMKKNSKDELINLNYLFDLSPHQFQEKIQNILDKLDNMYIQEMYNLRTSNKARLHMRSIGTIIWNSILMFLKQIGLMNRNSRQSVVSIRNVIQSPNFERDVLQEYLPFIYLIPIVRELEHRIYKLSRENNLVEKGYLKSRFNFTGFVEDNRSLGIVSLDTFGTIENFVLALANCLLMDDKFLEVKEMVESLFKLPPNVVKRVISYRLGKDVPKHPFVGDGLFSEFDALLCQILSNAKVKFDVCLKMMKSLEKCTDIYVNRFSRSNRNYLLKQLNVLQKSINDLETVCNMKRVDKKFRVHCRDNLTGNLFFSKPVNESFVTSRNVTNYLKRIVSKSELASNFLKEMSLFNRIYNKAKAKKDKLSKTNEHLKKDYRKISRALKRFEINIGDIILNAVSRLHRMMIEVQKLFTTMATRALTLDLSENLRTCDCCYYAMRKLLSVSDKSRYPKKLKIIGDERSNALIDKNYVKRPLEHLMKTMKRLRQADILNRSSSIVTLANTFLLATVFYESISMIAFIMYGGNGNNHFNPTSNGPTLTISSTPPTTTTELYEFSINDYGDNYDMPGDSDEMTLKKKKSFI